MSWKLLKMSHGLSLSLEGRQSTSSRRAPDSWLSSMPMEILKIIFSYLSPQTLVTIRELGVTRLTEISLTMKVADFSQCSSVHLEDISSFFTKDRVEHIKEISFDNVFFINSVNLEKYITKCKHLTVLSVIECGISYTNILCILKNCSELKELYWTLCIKKSISVTDPTCEDVFENVKKLYLHVKTLRIDDFIVLKRLLEICPKAQDVCFNISPYFSRTLPHDNATVIQTGRIFFKNREHPVNFVTYNRLYNYHDDAYALMERFSKSNDKKMEDIFRIGEDLSFFISNFSSFLQFITDEKDMAKLSLVPEASVHSLIMIMNDQKAKLLNHIEKIKQVTGSKLKHLTLLNNSIQPYVMEDDIMVESSGSAFMCDILSQIVCNSMNLSVLNLSDMHFDNPFPFSALYCLKRLKVFSISSCCMKDPAFDHEKDIYEAQIRGFEGLVRSCVHVEKFSFLI